MPTQGSGNISANSEDGETPCTQSSIQTDVESPNAHMDDEYQDATMYYSGLELDDEVDDVECTVLAPRARVDFADPHLEDEDSDAPDELTTRALARQ